MHLKRMNKIASKQVCNRSTDTAPRTVFKSKVVKWTECKMMLCWIGKSKQNQSTYPKYQLNIYYVKEPCFIHYTHLTQLCIKGFNILSKIENQFR